MKIKGILFDKDDTLIDLPAFWYLPIKKTILQILLHYRNTNSSELFDVLMNTAGFDGEKAIPSSPIVSGTNTDVTNAWKSVLLKNGIVLDSDYLEDTVMSISFFARRYGCVKSFCDLKELMLNLKSRNLILGIATSDDYLPTIHCLKSLEISSCFDSILTADRVSKPKPYPEMMIEFCNQHNIKPEEVIMVGDSKSDMLFALNSGANGVYFNRNSNNNELPPGAKYQIKELEKLQSIINCFSDTKNRIA